MQQATPRPDPRQALAIRRWALAVLAGATGDRAAAEARLAECSGASWTLFLRAERCAAALDARLTPEAGAGLSPQVRQTITRAAEAEVKRALVARGQLRAIGRLAREIRIPVIVLKGGVPVARGTNLHLVDIDLLVRPQQADALAAALESEGFTAAGWSSPRHLAARVAPGALPIEIHTTTDRRGAPQNERAWTEARPIQAAPGLHRLAPPDHLWHALSHAVIDHPYRRGRIRDMIVLADALGLCSQSEIEAVIQRSATTPRAETCQALVAAARELFADPAKADAFETTAFQHYTAAVLMNQLPTPFALRETVWKWTFALLGGRPELHEVWSDTVAVSLTTSPYGVVSRVERRFPKLGRVWRLKMRLLRLTLSLPIAIFIASVVRHRLFDYDHDHGDDQDQEWPNISFS